MTGRNARSRVGTFGQLLFSPIRFFRARLERPPNYPAALAPLAAYVVLTTATVLVSGRKTREVTDVALDRAQLGATWPAWVGDAIGGVSTVTTVGFLFVVNAIAVMALDALFAQSGRARRLVEFTALSYWSQLPFAAVWLGITAWWWRPEPLHLPAGVTSVELLEILQTYRENADTGVLATLRLVGTYFWCWFIALQCAALRAAAGFTVGGAWAAGLLLGTLFVGVPYAAERFW